MGRNGRSRFHTGGVLGDPSGTSLPQEEALMKAIYLSAALLLSAFALSPASAAPAAPLQASAVHSPLILAQYHPHDQHNNHHSARHAVHHAHYIAGHRYHSAPRGWHRYHARPHDWHTRGCILVGPLWFCP